MSDVAVVMQVCSGLLPQHCYAVAIVIVMFDLELTYINMY